MKRFVRKELMIFLAAALLAMLMPSAYASGNVSEVKLNQVQQTDADLTMYVSLADADGAPCTPDLAGDRFFVSVDGQTLDVDGVQPFDPETQGVHYVFAVDVSTSLTEEMMTSIRGGLSAFVDGLGPKDTVSILTFGTQVKKILANSADQAAIKETIAGIQPTDDKTALYKGVNDAAQLASDAAGRSAVIFITDGWNDPPEDLQAFTKESVYDTVKTAQVPLYCIGLNDAGSVDTESLADFAVMTGGKQFVIVSGSLQERLGQVGDIMRGAVSLHAGLVNVGGKSGFGEASTFAVRYEPAGGGYVESNELEQKVNWTNVPLPSDLLPPQLLLRLDDQQIEVPADGTVTLTGYIDVEQGTVADSDLTITVNGEVWPAEIRHNGAGYTFSATGMASGGELRVCAEIPAQNIASGYQSVTLTMPEATPVPKLSLVLDSGDKKQLVPGKTATISGEIDVQGEVDPNELVLYVNKTPVQITPQQVDSNQYAFQAAIQLPADSGQELEVQVRLGETATYSRPQVLVLSPAGSGFIGEVRQTVEKLVDDGTIWWIAGGAAALLLLIIILAVSKRRKKVISTDKEERKQKKDRDVPGGDSNGGGTEGGDGGGTEGGDNSGKRKTRRIVKGTENGGTAGGRRTVRKVKALEAVDVIFEVEFNGEKLDQRSIYIKKGESVILGGSGGNVGAQIEFNDGAISGRHLMFTFDGQKVQAEDMGSSNGTTINGKAMTAYVKQDVKNGDAIELGDTVLRVHLPSQNP